MSVKLPKQWRHWCKLMKLKPEGRGKYNLRHFALIGRGRRWRVNMYGQFQMSEPHETFDRWANSVDCSVYPLPNTKTEFIKNVNEMLRVGSL